MDMKLELVLLPVSDVDRAKAFYVERVGFKVDHDVTPGNTMRVVQLTPPGSACSIVIGTGISDMQPGSVKGLHLVVADIHKARETLAGQGVDVGAVNDLGGIMYVSFSDPEWQRVVIAGDSGYRVTVKGIETAHPRMHTGKRDNIRLPQQRPAMAAKRRPEVPFMMTSW